MPTGVPGVGTPGIWGGGGGGGSPGTWGGPGSKGLPGIWDRGGPPGIWDRGGGPGTEVRPGIEVGDSEGPNGHRGQGRGGLGELSPSRGWKDVGESPIRPENLLLVDKPVGYLELLGTRNNVSMTVSSDKTCFLVEENQWNYHLPSYAVHSCNCDVFVLGLRNDSSVGMPSTQDAIFIVAPEFFVCNLDREYLLHSKASI
ncbi:uncharacterized protein LOC112324921 [Populus trichocarpa]|uniref:uncharacterized protein LOC112324921 n=1 Tax=Populus trichocarpa TaxID=3694 RepID=UPI000D18A14F|nr:uncharacterized protein LOC112324921 [Populus trichocarpa]|eukprot:XP_024445344.1 collagen alpha-5(IV) chain-like [Populus trichocarpa]